MCPARIGTVAETEDAVAAQTARVSAVKDVAILIRQPDVTTSVRVMLDQQKGGGDVAAQTAHSPAALVERPSGDKLSLTTA